MERKILKTLIYSVNYEYPQSVLTQYLEQLGHANNQELMEKSQYFMRISAELEIFSKYPLEEVACSCIELALRQLHLQLLDNPLWYTRYEIDIQTIKYICYRILGYDCLRESHIAEEEDYARRIQRVYVDDVDRRRRSPTPPPPSLALVNLNSQPDDVAAILNNTTSTPPVEPPLVPRDAIKTVHLLSDDEVHIPMKRMSHPSLNEDQSESEMSLEAGDSRQKGDRSQTASSSGIGPCASTSSELLRHQDC